MHDDRHYWWLKRDYILKCQQAEEIQAWWKKDAVYDFWENPIGNSDIIDKVAHMQGNIQMGDTVSIDRPCDICIIGRVMWERQSLEYELAGKRGFLNRVQRHCELQKSHYTWVPSISRLADLWHDQNGLPASEFMNRFLTWYDKEQLVFNNVETYALHFVMDTVFSKVWTGDKWIE